MSRGRIANVLVVEDELLLLDLVTAELEDAGLTVIQAGTAEAALAALAGEAAIDLLFTDIRLPGAMDGWRLAEEAVRLRPDLRVIYATGFSGAAPRLTPGSLFFTKPYRPSAIIAAIRSFQDAARG
ncbi:response regulator receiver protein [Methylobacterium sp. 4-46]|uniref:response regulator n=1 Tax=unclassified Methylobacterium TaxID=2615210 RepID=UPI000152C73E|nr:MULTISPECIES: response regulator [Methylobacterium]ACA17121.1 response regulator receiver protein [Methylobacterium sp. 4-46]WFT82806.1 response regulator [Methylobacterium nodulans]